MILLGTAYPSQTKLRNSSRLHILRRAAERKGLYFLPGNFAECNPLAFKINSCSHSRAMLAGGPMPRSGHIHPPHTPPHPCRSSGSLGERGSMLQSELLLPQELVPLANPYPDFAVPLAGLWQTSSQCRPGWGKHQGVDKM